MGKLGFPLSLPPRATLVTQEMWSVRLESPSGSIAPPRLPNPRRKLVTKGHLGPFFHLSLGPRFEWLCCRCPRGLRPCQWTRAPLLPLVFSKPCKAHGRGYRRTSLADHGQRFSPNSWKLIAAISSGPTTGYWKRPDGSHRDGGARKLIEDIRRTTSSHGRH
jgi:hypothetical protein